jgi:hypothetical protein
VVKGEGRRRSQRLTDLLSPSCIRAATVESPVGGVRRRSRARLPALVVPSHRPRVRAACLDAAMHACTSLTPMDGWILFLF